MSIKVKDLASMLDLSPSTISMVLNNKPGISEATRKKVRDAVMKLGCEEMLSADVREKRNILFIVYRKHGVAPESTPYFSQIFSEIIEGVESQIKARGYNLMISYLDERNVYEEAAQIKKETAVGALVLATELREEQFDAFTDMQIPIVMMDNYMGDRDLDCVTINNEQGVLDVIGHLKEMGHRRIGYLHVCGNANNFTERYYAYLRAMEEYGLQIEPENVITVLTSEGKEDVYRELYKSLEGREKLPTAFFADNDIIATCAMRVLREMKLRIPEDISIVGFDNITLSEMLDPPLTTVQIPKREIGSVAVNTIIEKINRHIGGVMKIEVKPKLIVRGSVKRLS